MASKNDVYCTSYCNRGHQLSTGKPVDHECVVLPPKALEKERADDFAGAIREIEEAKPLQTHRGIKGRK